MLPNTPNYSAQLVRLLRQRLSETDARDIGNDFGQRIGQGVRLYDRLPGDGLDARISALVDRAQQLDNESDLLAVCCDWRPDLSKDLNGLLPPALSSDLPVRSDNLPRGTGTDFLGRKEDIDRVMEGLKSRYPLISIEGMAGVGKTSLAIEVAHACLPNAEIDPNQLFTFDYIVWVSARDKLEQKHWLNEVLNTVAKVMNFISITQRPEEQLDQKKGEVDDLLRSRPKGKSVRVLVIVDNFETMVDPDLVNWLENVPEPSKVLITTRQSRLQKTWAVELKGLEGSDALEFIRQQAHASDLPITHVSDDTLLSLVKVTEGNPKAIEMALGYIKGGNLNFNEAIKQLQEAGEQVEAVFKHLFERSFKLLSEEGKNAFLVVPLFVGSFTKEAMRAASGLSAFEFGQALQQLVDMKLLNFNHESERYTIHPLTRSFAKVQLTKYPEFQTEARLCWSQYYFKFVSDNVIREKPQVRYWNALVNDGMMLLDAEWPSIYEVLNWADQEGEDQFLLDFVMLLVHYMDSRFYNLERLTFVKRAVEVANKMGRKEEEALLRIDALGWTYVEEYRLEDAFREITTGLDIVEQIIGESEGESENATDLRALGLAWQARVMIEQERSIEAFQLIEKALAITCKPWIRFRVKMAAGDIALKQGKNVEALQYYEDCAQVTQEYGTEGHGYQTEPRIGMAYLATGELEKAEEKFLALRDLQHISIGKLYAEYGEAFIAYQRGDIAGARHLADAARKELSRRTTSNLLLILINKLFKDLEAGNLAI
jgi:LuxR family glucitol operon transcriptional activator